MSKCKAVLDGNKIQTITVKKKDQTVVAPKPADDAKATNGGEAAQPEPANNAS